MINIINGDILTAQNTIICQQVNHQGVMGSGLAKQIREKYPDIFNGYQAYCLDTTFEYIRDFGVILCYEPNPNIQRVIIANICSQEFYGRDGKCYTDYKALESGFRSIDQLIDEHKYGTTKYSVSIPYKIGCGLGGGDWDIVYAMIQDIFEGNEVYIYKYK